MSGELQGLLRLVGRTVTDPAGVAQELMRRNYETQTLWMGLLLVSVLSVLLLAVSNALLPTSVPEGAVVLSPFAYGAIIAASIVLLVYAVHLVGRLFGGTGTFPQTMVLMIWLQVVAMAVQVAQILAMLILPPLAGMVSLAGAFLMLYCLMQFINALHGFDSLVKAIGVFVVAVIAIGLFLAVVLSLVGVNLAGAPA